MDMTTMFVSDHREFWYPMERTTFEYEPCEPGWEEKTEHKTVWEAPPPNDTDFCDVSVHSLLKCSDDGEDTSYTDDPGSDWDGWDTDTAEEQENLPDNR